MEKARKADSWSIDYSVKNKCVYISTNDYHAEPLKLSTEQLRKMLYRLDPSDKLVQSSPDVQEAKNLDSPFYGISKKEKTFYIGIPDCWTGLLQFSRDDLYRFAGMMNKRVKSGKKSKSD
jgi:hypothetical protein